ncbi:hypothetical protein GDO81_027306, partial [Engystomops pustulosus]
IVNIWHLGLCFPWGPLCSPLVLIFPGQQLPEAEALIPHGAAQTLDTPGSGATFCSPETCLLATVIVPAVVMALRLCSLRLLRTRPGSLCRLLSLSAPASQGGNQTASALYTPEHSAIRDSLRKVPD